MDGLVFINTLDGWMDVCISVYKYPGWMYVCMY